MKGNLVKPGEFEVYFGPMKSGKTHELLNRVEKLNYVTGVNFKFYKPSLDERDKDIKARNTLGKTYPSTFIEASNPYKLLDEIGEEQVIGIDEAQFFSNDITDVVEELKKDKNVIASFLDLDFKGEPFGPAPYLIAMADKVKKLESVCDYEGCNNSAKYTQRFIDGKPAHANSPLVLIDNHENYEARCKEHHIVPGKDTRQAEK